VFLKGTSGKRLSEVYLAAWKMGLKTTYYLRSLAATQIEKSTLDAARFGYTQKREYEPLAAAGGNGSPPAGGPGESGAGVPGSGVPRSGVPEPQLCRVDDPECEACQ
jgi:ribonucleoside-diphosphate reductase alpha chain